MRNSVRRSLRVPQDFNRCCGLMKQRNCGPLVPETRIRPPSKGARPVPGNSTGSRRLMLLRVIDRRDKFMPEARSQPDGDQTLWQRLVEVGVVESAVMRHR